MYLHGPNWEDLRGKKATRPLVKEDVYGFHVLKDDGVVVSRFNEIVVHSADNKE